MLNFVIAAYTKQISIGKKYGFGIPAFLEYPQRAQPY